MNKKIIEEFEKLIFQVNFELKNSTTKTEKTKNNFRLNSLSRSLQIIKKFNKSLTENKNIIELSKIKSIGKGTIDRIKEINKTGKLEEITITKQNIKKIKKLLEIYGIGFKTCLDFVNDGLDTYEKLKTAIENKKIKVNRNIQLGIKYYNKFFEHIPHETVKKHKKLLQTVAKEIDENLTVKVCGSYRRKQKYSNDIDVILCYKYKTTNAEKKAKTKLWLKIFTDKLKQLGYISDEITKSYNNKYMCFVKESENIYRRLDIEYIDILEYPTALLYFTGNKYFNIYIRKKAIEQGYKLNEHGIYKNNKKIQVKNEKDIFNLLKITYIAPIDRNY